MHSEREKFSVDIHSISGKGEFPFDRSTPSRNASSPTTEKKSLHLKTSQQRGIGQQAQSFKRQIPQEVFQQSTAVRVTFHHDFRESSFSTMT